MRFTRRLEDYAIVTLVTALIWFYAESRMRDTYSDPPVPIPLEVQIAGEDLVVTRHSPREINNFEFTGSSAAISALKGEMAGAIRIQLDALQSGTYTLPLSELVANQYGRLNVSLRRISPSALDVTVQRMVTREAMLVWDPEDIKLEDKPKIEPPTVEIRLPEDRIPDVTGADQAITLSVRPTADLRALASNVLHPHIPATVELPDTLVGNRHVVVTPRNVSLSFTIEDREARHTLPSVPVFVSAPPAVWANFRVQPHEEDRLINNVSVAGPPELIQRVRNGDITVIAQPVLDRDDLVRGAASETMVAPLVFLTRPSQPRLSIESPKTSVRLMVRRLDE